MGTITAVTARRGSGASIAGILLSALLLLVSSSVRPAFAASGDFREATGTRLVLVPVHVTDGDGKTIGDLTRDHFQIFDEGAPREIVSFTTEEAPVSLGIVMDLSASMQAKLPQAISALREATGRFGPGDETFLLTFSSHPSLRQGFTGDVASLTDNLQFARTEGRTALVDAVYQALEQVRRGRNPRKALLVISDGGDNNSRYRESELLEAALESNTDRKSTRLNSSH